MKKHKKYMILLLAAAVMLFAGASYVCAETDSLNALVADFKFNVNRENIEPSEQPVVIDGKTYLPVRATAELLDKRIGWDEDTKTVVIKNLLEDGIYKAEQEEFNEHGWKAVITLTVEEGKIVNVEYDEVNKDGDYKSEDEEYLAQFKEMTGTGMLEAIKELENSLVNNQSIELVDAVSCATYSSNYFMSLAEEALEKGPVEE